MSSVLASGWSIVVWVGLVVAVGQIAVAHHRQRRGSTDAIGRAWWAIAAVGFAVTWTFMIRMAVGDVARHPSLAAWGRDSNLFFDAYRRVTSTAPAWWWSQQLMAWALAGALWFSVEGRRRAIRFWAYPWLAMCVAVSVALPIFAQRLRSEKISDPRAGVPLPVAAGVLVATLALVATPFLAGPSFVVAMFVLHAGVLVPAIATPRASSAAHAVALRPVACVVAFVCFAIHLVATLRLHETPLGALFDVVVRDPAQASISSDVVLTWLACALLVATSRGRSRAVAFFLLAPLVSLGAAFAWAVLLKERAPTLPVDVQGSEGNAGEMPTGDEIESAAPPMSRDDLIALVARAHQDSAYGESALAGRTLAAQSKLPKVIAENLGAGFGQWDFFPEAADIVDFAFAYTPPSTEEDVWTMARAWASDDAGARPTLMALVGREVLQHELRRIDVPKLRELFDAARPSRARELRASLGLEVPPVTPAKAAPAKAAPAKRAPAPVREIPTRMPKPEFKRPAKAAPPAEAKRFQHPKFGEGVLEAQDGVGPDAKLTIKFESGAKTLLARYVTERPA